MTFRKTVAASVAAICLTTSVQLPAASAATVENSNGTCTARLTLGEDQYLQSKTEIPVNSEQYAGYFAEEAKEAQAAVEVIKGLLSNDKTKELTRQFLSEVEEMTKHPESGERYYPALDLYASVAEDTFTDANDPTIAFKDYIYDSYSSRDWRTRAASALQAYAKYVYDAITTNYIVAEADKGNYAAVAVEYRGYKDRWNNPSASRPVRNLDPDNSDFAAALINACKNANPGSGPVTVASPKYSYDDFLKDQADLYRKSLSYSADLFSILKASEQELGVKITSAVDLKVSNAADEKKSGFNWKLILIIVAVLGALGAAAAVTMMPKPPVA